MKKVLFVAAVVVVVASLWSWKRASAPADDSRTLVTDRVWIDHIPRSERDTIHVFVAITEHPVGVFQATSQWRGQFEAFRYEATSGEMRLVFPQTGARETVRTKARRCDQDGMDFCLELDGASRGAKRYYSRKGWEIDGARDVDAIERRLDAVRAQLGAN